MTAYCAHTVLRTSRFRIALPQQAARAIRNRDYRNDSTASRMRSLYTLHLSLSVAILAIQPRLRLSGTNHLRSAFHGGQRLRIERFHSRGFGYSKRCQYPLYSLAV
ncbi:MAG: hypothetical protein KZQ66_19955 [Candidatus Thiodiazotropha sp. (ex Lucinoma aequizonata)]|nr:hypothetical protein [Candidatus Thiodiazotropha sp. (ex Lucinoma aequizonata)]MCU7894928.1 hypothetical protein [Candidatus Thiodiazotropha sp. (ex Lucinoma aequizonata)]MCU7903971.1 hypothetical protein [Candidatus Thiodiazotropha sp. (ex Lucinoma aequizonata)]MCU7909948.1 hypothetical protein [Candidatus Thiodiazotropha sp. (ex Lucinoma aequizonata)]